MQSSKFGLAFGLVLMFILCFVVVTRAAEPGYKTIGLKQFAALQQKAMKGEKHPLLLDVRSGPEFFAGHIPGTDHLPTQLLSKVTEILKDKNAAIVVYCRTNNRATSWAEGLVKQGYKDVTLYTGGIIEWIKAGKELGNLFMGRFKITQYHKLFVGPKLDPYTIRLGQPEVKK